MFTVAQIEEAHAQVKSGADFPGYIRAIRSMGVLAFDTQVKDSSTRYEGVDGFQVFSEPQYAELTISPESDVARFAQCLKNHQQGLTDYFTFCRHCAETGITGWRVDLKALTCTYFNRNGEEVLTESIPVAE